MNAWDRVLAWCACRTRQEHNSKIPPLLRKDGPPTKARPPAFATPRRQQAICVIESAAVVQRELHIGRAPMGGFRDFTNRHIQPVERNIDDDAPGAMRQELVDFVFHLVGQTEGLVRERQIYEITGLMLGAGITANPYGGHLARVSRDIGAADWPRVYDWLSRLWPEFEQAAFHAEYRNGVNNILAGNGVVWDLNEAGHMERVLPTPLRQQVNAANTVLGDERFAAARQTFELATEAFNDRPRRDRDACANAYDALESAAKIAFNMPRATFGEVLNTVGPRGDISAQAVRLLRAIEVFGHNTFRHGGVEPFTLTPGEVDFVYTACAAATLVFAR
jgi:hypothetical protein